MLKYLLRDSDTATDEKAIDEFISIVHTDCSGSIDREGYIK